MRREDGVAVACWIDRGTADRFDRIAKKLNISKSRLGRNLLMSGLDDAEVLDSMGLLTLANMIEETKKRIRIMKEEARVMVQAEG